MADEIATHPVQTKTENTKGPGRCPQVVTLAAYEVYKKIYGEQKALIEGACRGGFGAGELIAYLYARSFPQNEWRSRADEAFIGMTGV